MRILIAHAKQEDWFDELSLDQQKQYLKEHPHSHRKLTAHKKDPTASKETKMVDGKRVMHDGSPLPDHIQALKIPPGWANVKVNSDPKGALLVIGRDAKGRLQSIYSEEFANTQAEHKFARVSSLHQEYAGMVEQNTKARKSKKPAIRDAADCMHLIMTMGLRPGSDKDTGADKKAYGATTLQAEHVVEENGRTFLRFTGKKGVALSLPVEDPATARMLRARAKEAGEGKPLFPNTNAEKLQDHSRTLDGGHFTPKDFRTHLATKTAADSVAMMEKPTNEKDYRKAVLSIAKQVSKKLGNTPTVALQSYINPTVFAGWRL